MREPTLGDSLGTAAPSSDWRADPNWKPDDFPNLSGIKEIQANFETTGLNWRTGGDKPISLTVGGDGLAWFLPFGFRGGGRQHDEEMVRRWAKSAEGLRGKRIVNSNTKFEVHMARVWDCDLEELGCEVSDVQHYAALLDDHRRRFNLDLLVKDMLGEEPMARLDESRLKTYPANVAAERAKANVLYVERLKNYMWPLLDKGKFQEVRALEDQVIFPVCEMEKNGALLDVEKLRRWLVEANEDLHAMRKEVARACGIKIQDGLFKGAPAGQYLNTNSGKQMEAMFKKLGLPIKRTKPTESAPDGNPSFTSEYLATIDHPVVKLIIKQSKLEDLLSKYLVPYNKLVGDDGHLWFALHQLRGDENGTVRGRFSMSGGGGGGEAKFGANLQQVMKAKKQRKQYGDKYIVRELFISEPGTCIVSIDAEQIEYRIFADREASPSTFAAYEADPWLNFHELTRKKMLPWRPELDYDKAKTCNFLTVYGGGLVKLALNLEFITGAQAQELWDKYAPRQPPWSEPILAEALNIKRVYQQVMPGAKRLTDEAMLIAKSTGGVRSILGRLATFPGGDGAHAALNAIIQPSAADVMKTKMVEAHKARKQHGVKYRLTVHDEFVFDSPSKEATKAVQNLLNIQTRPSNCYRIPILWAAKAGLNWAETTEKLEDAFANTRADKTRDGRNR